MDKNAIDYVKSKMGNNPRITYENKNIFHLIKEKREQKFDVMYSVGLMDYLNEKGVSKVFGLVLQKFK
eukprot:UN33521